MVVTSAENALYVVKRMLYREYKILITKERWVDMNRKAIIQDKNGNKFFVLFKREFFITYGKITGEEGVGESINVMDFENAVYEENIEQFIYVYPCNRVYKIRAIDIRKHCHRYKNESDGREQYLFSAQRLQKIA